MVGELPGTRYVLLFHSSTVIKGMIEYFSACSSYFLREMHKGQAKVGRASQVGLALCWPAAVADMRGDVRRCGQEDRTCSQVPA